VLAAFVWGALGASALLVGALIAYVRPPSRQVLAIIMALGTGVLIGSVSFELIDDAIEHADIAQVGALTLVGALVFTAGNWWINRSGGGGRKDAGGAQQEGSAKAIVFGSVLDGIPESFVLGLTVLQGQVSVALFAGIVLSNLPEGMSSSAGLRVAGWTRSTVIRMWLAVIAVSAVAAACGYVLLDPDGGRPGALAEAFAAGALLAMVADTLLPEAFEVEGVFTGSLVAIGFSVSLMLAAV
jgi:zinc transporter, ZIP family